MRHGVHNLIGLAGAVGLVLFVIYGIVRGIANVQGVRLSNLERLRYLVGTVGLGALILLIVGAMLLANQRWERAQASLAAAKDRAASADTLVAREQPVPIEPFAALPTVLVVRTNWWRWLASVAEWAVLCVLGCAAVYVVFEPQPSLENYMSDLWVIALLIVVPYAFFFAWFRVRAEITEIGIMTRGTNGNHFVAFEGALLFAIPRGQRKHGPPLYYTLSSGVDTVTLMRPRRRMVFPLGDPMKTVLPTTSWDEYDRRLDTAQGVIAARTGLPLYDLR